MKIETMMGQFSLKCLDSRIQTPLLIDKRKLLIGSQETCDLRISDKSISSYHAFIYLKGNEGFMVKDLYSEGGVYVNGQKINESFVNPGDVITFGTVSFSIESLGDEVPVFLPEEGLNPSMAPDHIELPSRPGLVFIDGEYCDIHFDETNFKPLTSLPLMSFKGDYIDLDATGDVLEIAHNVKAKKLEIVSYINGLMHDISYTGLKDGDYFLTSEKKGKRDILFNTLSRTKIFEIKSGKLRFFSNDKLTPSMEWEKIDLNNPLFLTHGSEQISLRFVDKEVKWKGIPLLYRDREFLKQASKVFFPFILPFLLLVFVSIPTPEKETPEVAVIYKLTPPPVADKPTPSEAVEKVDVKAEEVTSTVENTGHKENVQKPEKVEFSQASQKKQIVAKATTPKPAPVAAEPVKEAPPVKAYEFKSSVAVSSLVADAPKINTKGSAAKNAVKDTTFNAGSSDNGQLVAGANIGVSKFNTSGADNKGTGANSYGSKGLASKAGIDTSYLEPKTVVLGSMDPELLRKILREYIPQFRHCYQQELIGHSEKIKGVIDLNFTISATGKVAKHAIKAKDARFSQKGINCMGQVLSLIEFPKPKGGGVVDVKQPLNFFAETEKI